MRLLAAAAAVAMLAASCGGGSGGDGNEGGGGNATSTEDEGTPKPGGRIVYGLEAETTAGWCLPEAQLAISGIQVAKTIYDTLTAPDSTGAIKPFLAESVEPNATYDKFTIKLRPGVKFHDGSALTAEVVKNNLDAYRGQYPARKPLLFVFVLQNIASVDVVDDLTLTVSTTKPWPALPDILYGSGRMGILAQAQLDNASACNKDLIGTGPFKLKEWAPNEKLIAEKNADYWQKDADGVQLPYLDEIEYRPVPDGDQRRQKIQTGELDAGHLQNGEQLVPVRELAESGELKLLDSDAFAEVSYLMFNESKPPFDNKNARMAVAYAIDRDEYNELRNEGIQKNASGPFAEGVPGYLADTGYPEFDLAKAKEAVAAYKTETGSDLSFTITSTSDPGTVTSTELIQSMLKDVGVEVKLSQTDQATLIDRALASEFEANLWRNHPGGDPDTQYNWWHGGSPVNFGRIADTEMDRLLDEGRVEIDPAKRSAIYEDLNKRFASEVHNAWLQWALWGVPHQNRVNGIEGPLLPDGSEPFPGLGAGHPVTGIWVSE